VATGLGVLLFLAPWETAVVFVVWCVIVGLTRLVSLGSVTAAVLVPVVMWLFGEPVPLIVFGAAAALFVVVRHKENIRRLVQGKELKAEHLGKK
jgi:glycerol-3-phosphate acyltransferase PlsY